MIPMPPALQAHPVQSCVIFMSFRWHQAENLRHPEGDGATGGQRKCSLINLQQPMEERKRKLFSAPCDFYTSFTSSIHASLPYGCID